MVYVYAVLPNHGLGNMLFPWARAELFAHRYQLRMLSPQWFQLRLGPYLRGDSDKREYWRLFASSDYIGGARKALALATHRRMGEPFGWYHDPAQVLPERGVFLFEGLKPRGTDADYFLPLMGHDQFLRQRLLRIARPSALAQVPMRPDPFIAVHIRRGDMAASICSPSDPTYVPPLWYFEMACALRKSALFSRLPIRVFTDGGGPGLREFASLADVEFVNYGNALSNILGAAQAAVLVGTSYSTFSRWISFLGAVPTIYHPNTAPPPVRQPGGTFEGGLAPESMLPEKLLSDVAGRLAKLAKAP